MTAIFGHGELKLYLLSLLEERPQHGYEMITALSDRFGGTYRPSAGTVYPRLDKLTEEGLVERTEEGRKATYQITDAGRTYLEEHRAELEQIEKNLTESVTDKAAELRAKVKNSMDSLRAELAVAAEEARSSSKGHPRMSMPDAGFPPPTAFAPSRSELKQIERELTAFRNDLRDAARRAADSGKLGELATTTVTTVLRQARASIEAVFPK